MRKIDKVMAQLKFHPVRRARVKRHLSVTNLANLSGVSRNTICAIERRERTPLPLTLGRLSNALEVDVEELVDEEKPKEKLAVK